MNLRLAALIALLLGGGLACSDVPDGLTLPQGFQHGMHRPRQFHTATLLHGGKYAGCVVVVGGLDENQQAVGEIELYDPSLDAWTVLEKRSNRVFHTASWVQVGEDGYVLVAGGYDLDQKPMSEALRIHDDGTITLDLQMLPRAEHTATSLGDGRILFAGGGQRMSHIYDVTKIQPWTDGPSLGDPESAEVDLGGSLFGHAAVLLDERRVLLVGGARTNFYDLEDRHEPADAWLCDVDSPRCEPAPAPRNARKPQTHALVRLLDTDPPGMLVLGGQVATEYRDPSTGEWQSPPPWVPASSPSRAAIVDVGEDIVVLGGFADGIESRDEGLILRPSLGTVGETHLQVPRIGHTATLLDDGVRILVAGGRASPSSAGGPIGASEIVDLRSGSARPPAGLGAPVAPREQLASPLSCALQASLGGGSRRAALIGLAALLGLLARRRGHRSWLERLSSVLGLLLAACADDLTALETSHPLRAADAASMPAATPDGGIDATLEAAAQIVIAPPTLDVTWSRIPLPEPQPVPRFLSTLVFDPAREQLVLFGGASIGGGLGDTWTMDLATTPGWVESSGQGPSARAAHAMTYSREAGFAILFGGSDPASLGDTWSQTAGQWSLICGVGCAAPPPRHGHAMVYDEARENVVLFGGRNDTGALGDTWVWTSTDGWLEACPGAAGANPCEGPPARYHHSLLYDEATERVVLYGGKGKGEALNDTWLWDGHGWARHTGERLNGLVAHAGHTFGYDPTARIWVAFGGIVKGAPNAAVWGYSDIDDKIWIRGNGNSPAPPARAFGPMTWDPVGQRFLIFGGGIEGEFHDLWALKVEYHSLLRDCRGRCATCPEASHGLCSSSCSADAGASTCAEWASDAGVDASLP